MKIGERGQVTIPQTLRDRFGLQPHTEVEFVVVEDRILLQKQAKKIPLRRWKGKAKKSFGHLRISSVDKYIDDIRGR